VYLHSPIHLQVVMLNSNVHFPSMVISWVQGEICLALHLPSFFFLSFPLFVLSSFHPSFFLRSSLFLCFFPFYILFSLFMSFIFVPSFLFDYSLLYFSLIFIHFFLFLSLSSFVCLFLPPFFLRSIVFPFYWICQLSEAHSDASQFDKLQARKPINIWFNRINLIAYVAR